jgi:hypothetical protein
MNWCKIKSIWVLSLGIATIMLAGCSAGQNPDNSSDATTASKEKSGGMFSREREVTIPAGTSVAIVLDQRLASNESHTGDSFDATLSEPITSAGKIIIPKDARIHGRVTDAQESGRLQTPARLAFTLAAVQVGGSWKDIQTDSVSMKGKSHKTRDIEVIGGGSALGALIGGLAGGGKGAAIGAAAGAGAGTAGAAATGKKEISVPAESHVTFRLTEPLKLKVKE